jgi:hypothetical protein
MMTAEALTADPCAIQQHLQHITSRWHEFGEPCRFEVRFLTNDDQATVKDVSRYSATYEGIADATAHIAAMNKHKLNAYVVVNPIDAEVRIEAGKAAKDEHIIGSVFHWADGDDAQAADNIRNFRRAASNLLRLDRNNTLRPSARLLGTRRTNAQSGSMEQDTEGNRRHAQNRPKRR